MRGALVLLVGSVTNTYTCANHPPLVRLVRPLDGSVFRTPADLGLAAQA